MGYTKQKDGAMMRSDAELVELARDNDMSAFDELVQRYRSTCLRKAVLLLRDSDEAEDQVQNAIWKAFKCLDQLKGASEFSGWLGRIVNNHCLNRLRARSRYRMFSLDSSDNSDVEATELPCQTEDPEYVLVKNQMENVIRREIRRIPSLLRNVVLLRDVQRLPMAEVALRLGITLPAARSRLFRAHMELRQRVSQCCGSRAYHTLRYGVQHPPAKPTCSRVLPL
jgi:RNA polymerase sigma-70 factor (ECF subfamily)